jgi:hypothetical protein
MVTWMPFLLPECFGCVSFELENVRSTRFSAPLGR